MTGWIIRCVLVVGFVLQLGCDSDGGGAGGTAVENDCVLSGPIYAADPATGDCQLFNNMCAVPVEWTRCPAAAPPCVEDLDCGGTQRCESVDPTMAPTCVDNELCVDESDCELGATCDLAAPRECPPGDEVCPTLGVCTRAGGEPTDRLCATSDDCVAGEVCPAEFGACSEDASGGCPSQCELACVSDGQCTADFRCNRDEVCTGPLSDDEACAGFCVAR